MKKFKNISLGKTGVMNVQQMQDAVYEGVFAAMTAAMRGQGNGGASQEIKVYLDGKEITASVKKHQHESGLRSWVTKSTHTKHNQGSAPALPVFLYLLTKYTKYDIICA